MKEELEQGKDREGKGAPSGLTCPECGGSLFGGRSRGLVHFRCRTGHAYSPESLLAKQSESVEATLWAAVRALQENAALARRMERRMRHDRRHSVAIGDALRQARRRSRTARRRAARNPDGRAEDPDDEEPREAEG